MVQHEAFVSVNAFQPEVYNVQPWKGIMPSVSWLMVPCHFSLWPVAGIQLPLLPCWTPFWSFLVVSLNVGGDCNSRQIKFWPLLKIPFGWEPTGQCLWSGAVGNLVWWCGQFGLVLWAIWSGAVGNLVWCCGQFYIALDLILNFITFVPSWHNN